MRHKDFDSLWNLAVKLYGLLNNQDTLALIGGEAGYDVVLIRNRTYCMAHERTVWGTALVCGMTPTEAAQNAVKKFARDLYFRAIKSDSEAKLANERASMDKAVWREARFDVYGKTDDCSELKPLDEELGADY